MRSPRSVVSTLKGRLAAGTSACRRLRRAARISTAYESYLEGRYHWNKRTEDELKKSVACFERAIDRDPDFAPAYAGMADAYVTLGTYGALPPKDVMPACEARRGTGARASTPVSPRRTPAAGACVPSTTGPGRTPSAISGARSSSTRPIRRRTTGTPSTTSCRSDASTRPPKSCAARWISIRSRSPSRPAWA